MWFSWIHRQIYRQTYERNTERCKQATRNLCTETIFVSFCWYVSEDFCPSDSQVLCYSWAPWTFPDCPESAPELFRVAWIFFRSFSGLPWIQPWIFLRHSGGVLGLSWGCFRVSWVTLEPLWLFQAARNLHLNFSRLPGILFVRFPGCLECNLGSFSGIWGASWGYLGVILGPLGPLLGPCGFSRLPGICT